MIRVKPLTMKITTKDLMQFKNTTHEQRLVSLQKKKYF